MKKIFAGMMLAGALLIGTTAYAQTDGTTGATKAQTEKKDCKGGQCANCPNGALKGGKKAYNPFQGIQLTDDQQQRLRVLQQGLGPVQLTPEMKAKIKENPNLTPEQKAQLKAEKKAKKLEAKKNYLGGVKEILTPEQYVVFLENVYVYGPDKQLKAAKKPNAKKMAKGDKMKKGNKGGKGKKEASKN